MSAFAHASSLLGYLVALGQFIPPLIIWLLKRDTDPWVADQAKESLNFQINVVLAYLFAIVFAFTGVGLLVAIPLFILIPLADLVFVIIATVKAYEGERYRYPISVRFL